MQYIVDIQNASQLETFIAFLEKLKLEFRPVEKPVRRQKTAKKKLPIIEGDHSIDPYALVGIWKDYPVTLEEIREKAWRTI